MLLSLLKALRNTAGPEPELPETSQSDLAQLEQPPLAEEGLSPEMRDALFPPASRMVSVIFD